MLNWVYEYAWNVTLRATTNIRSPNPSSYDFGHVNAKLGNGRHLISRSNGVPDSEYNSAKLWVGMKLFTASCTVKTVAKNGVENGLIPKRIIK